MSTTSLSVCRPAARRPSFIVSFIHEVHHPLSEQSRWRRPLRIVVSIRRLTVCAVLILGLAIAGESTSRVQATAQSTSSTAVDYQSSSFYTKANNDWSTFLGSSVALAYEPIDIEKLARRLTESVMDRWGHRTNRKEDSFISHSSSSRRRALFKHHESKHSTSTGIQGMHASAILLKKAAGSRRQQLHSAEYLASIAAIMPSFEALGLAIHAAAVKDLLGNAKKLEKNGAPDQAIFALVSADRAIGNHTHPDSSYQAFLWLTRILRFTATFFRQLVAYRDASLTHCLVASYETHLGPYHNVVMRSVAVALMQIIPDRASMIACFHVDEFEDLVPYLLKWADAAMLVVDKSDAFFMSLGEPTITKRAISSIWNFATWGRSSDQRGYRSSRSLTQMGKNELELDTLANPILDSDSAHNDGFSENMNKIRERRR
uniref:Glycolipid transfer protein domain-containing protein n=1 Tax=Aureoumbra lagunensis TaxID=44058 RepID=A0A7S3JN37_9STRA